MQQNNGKGSRTVERQDARRDSFVKARPPFDEALAAALRSSDRKQIDKALEPLGLGRDEGLAAEILRQHNYNQLVINAVVERLEPVVSKLIYETTLTYVATHASSRDARIIAADRLALIVETLTKPASFMAVATYSMSPEARVKAIARLKDNRDALSYVADVSEYEDSKKRAGELLATLK